MICAAALMRNTMATRTSPRPSASGKSPLLVSRRDCSRHHARDAINVAADDDDGADLGGGRPNPASTTGDERIARVPQQRRRGGRRRRAKRAQLLFVFVPSVFEHLA
jgi:hypothetical protein